MMSMTIIHRCIAYLLNPSNDEPSIEKLCVWLINIGKNLDQPRSSDIQQKYPESRKLKQIYIYLSLQLPYTLVLTFSESRKDGFLFRPARYHRQQLKNIKPYPFQDVSAIVGDGFYDKDLRRYDDNLQLFVGNILYDSTTAEELKASFCLNLLSDTLLFLKFMYIVFFQKLFIKCETIEDIEM